MKAHTTQSQSRGLGKVPAARSRRGVEQQIGRSVRSVLGAVCLLAYTLSSGGCAKEPIDPPAASSDKLTTITLVPEPMGDVAMGTRSLSDVSETAVKDLWVVPILTWSERGTPRYFDQSEIRVFNNQYSVQMSFPPGSYPNAGIYFLANTGDPQLFTGDIREYDVSTARLPVKNENSLSPNKALPMAGAVRTNLQSGNMLIPQVSLHHAVAKLTFKLAASLPSGHSFTLKSVKVKTVPNVLHPWRDMNSLDPGTDQGACYPATSPDFIADWADLTPKDKTLSSTAKECGWCYLPENGRGTGKSYSEGQKDADHALWSQGEYATYVEIKGEYRESYVKYPDLTYKIYLGGDAVSDYNVKRNTHYTVTVTLKGNNASDTRVELNSPAWDAEMYDYTENVTGRFLYQKTDLSQTKIYEDAWTACPNGYRLPTFTELQIMYCMRDNWTPTSNGFTAAYYWSSGSGAGDDAACLTFADGYTNNYGKLNSYRVRCVKTL